MAKKQQKQKLEIVSPDHERHGQAFLETIGVTAAICGVFLFVLTNEVLIKDRVVEKPKELTPVEKLAEKVEAPKSIGAPKRWTVEEFELALSQGDVELAEKACTRYLEKREELDEAQAKRVREALVERLEGSSRELPLSCAIRAHLTGALAEDEELDAITRRIWESFEANRYYATDVGRTIERMMKTRRRPDDPRFYRWLRHCAMKQDEKLFPFCLSMVRQISPKQGADFLSMVDRHVGEEGWKGDGAKAAASALGAVALAGQPAVWRIERAEGIPRYDYDARIGAVFMLCRLASSPIAQMRDAAVGALGVAARRGGRAVDQTKRERWLEACQLAFGKPMPDLEFVDEPIVDETRIEQILVPKVAPGELADHALDGVCVGGAGKPPWYCGVEMWKGKESDITDALGSIYVETRYIQWRGEDGLRIKRDRPAARITPETMFDEGAPKP